MLGLRQLPLTIKEVETAEELAGYHLLEEFHYRGKVLHGRRVPLIVRAEDPMLPAVLGYIELATTFIMNRPRAVLLDDVFHAAQGNITWTTWKKDAVRQYTNLVVRIARTVVSPEFRGLGLARILVKHARRFAKSHWHIARLKPLFMEITADMLRYVPFVESAGMRYIGDTEGNLSRVNEDMEYVLRNLARVKKREILREESAGIVDLQVSYAMQLEQIEKTKGIPREHLLKLLLRSPHKLSDADWAILHRILRLPKPTFLTGLTPEAERFVRQRALKLGLPSNYQAPRPTEAPPTLAGPIVVRDCSFSTTSSLVRTRSTRRVQQAFGVGREMLTTHLFANLSFKVSPGDILLICGPSGAGKTTLLALLSQMLRHPARSIEGLTGSMDVPPSANIATLGPVPSGRPLVDSLGGRTFEHSLHALNVSGLAEAHLYVKRFCELSNGQRYRAMVAQLIASQANVWIADEFCATLDPVTANIVSRNLRRCAKDRGTTAILAAANWVGFVHELKPDVTVHLRAPWDHHVYAWVELRNALARSVTALAGESPEVRSSRPRAKTARYRELRTS